MVKKVKAAHILVEGEKVAKEILQRLKEGNDFGKLAKRRSNCPSGKNGGDLGWFGRGKMVKEFEDAAFNADKGEVVGPVKTQFGFHIIKVNDQK